MNDQSIKPTKLPLSIVQHDEQETSGSAIFFNLRQLTQFRADRPYVQVLSDLGTARVVLLAFKAGQQLGEHCTANQLIVQVLRGRITFATASNTVKLQAGMLLQVEENVPHSISAQTDAVMLLTMLPNPAGLNLAAGNIPGNELAPLVKRE